MAERNPSKNGEIISVENVTKRFGGVVALDDVTFSIQSGEVHAIVGENGAGKSTLMKLLSGVQKQDGGKVFIHGREVELDSPSVSESLGIAMVYQELSLFLTLSVAANIFIGREKTSGIRLLDEHEMHRASMQSLNQLNVDLDPATRVETLSPGRRQIVEIARAVNRGTEVVIMDEPNSALNQHETQALFDVIQELKAQGITVLYVSHRLEEVFSIADRITVLRDGRYMGTWEKAETTVDQIVAQVVGRQLGEVFPEKISIAKDSEEVLSVKGLRLAEGAKPIEFMAKKGEVLGFAGLQGSGVEATFLSLFGLTQSKKAWELVFRGKRLDDLSSPELIENKWAFIPADRRAKGLMIDWSLLFNTSLVVIKRLISKLGLIQHDRERKLAEEYINKLNIVTDSLGKKVNTLSGGNQQKVVIAKWLASEPELFILDDPTRGIDVGTKQEIYRLIKEWAQQGSTLLFSSSEIEEVLGVCHRILVFYNNEIVAEFDADQTSKEEVMRYVLGGEVVGNIAA